MTKTITLFVTLTTLTVFPLQDEKVKSTKFCPRWQ